jgi:hypothetical protein
MDPATAAMLAQLGGQAISIFAKGKNRTPGFGLTNTDDIMSLLSAFGWGAGLNKYRQAGDTDIPAKSLVGTMQQGNARNLPMLDVIQKILAGNMTTGMNDLGRLQTQASGAANATRTRTLGALNGSYDQIKGGLSRDLERSIQSIFRQADAGAASRGIKSASTTSKAKGQARTQTESVYDMLANLTAREGEQKAGVEERTGNNILQTIMSMGQYGLATKQGLTSDYANNLLKMMGMRTQMEEGPMRTLMDVVRGFPSYNAQPTQSPGFAAQAGAGLQGIGSTIMGFQNYQNQQQMQQQMMPLILRMLGGGGGGGGGGGLAAGGMY